MNYAGKFDAALSLDGQGSHSPAHAHVDSFTAKGHGHVPAGAFIVPDPNLLFHGHFDRVGVDLVLSRDGAEFVVHDYFKGEKRAAIASPDGAHLTGDIVDALTGHVQVAQAAPGVAVAAAVIGHVTKLTGSATVVRNGVSIILNNGDNVEKGDAVATGSDSTLGITFIDGTVFGLSSNARMVLNEMVYDPNGSNNSSLLSLVAGTITFVAGETAKHGDMKVDTPVATMGIRGTAVVTEINFIIPSGGGDPQPQANFQVLVEPDGHTGSYILYDKTTLLPIATVNQAGQMIQISGGNVTVSNALLSPEVQKLISEVFTLKFTDNSGNTKLTSNFTDTITPDSNGFLIKTASGATAQVTTTTVTNGPSDTDPEKHDRAPPSQPRAPNQPVAVTTDPSGHPTTTFSITERAGQTNDTADSDVIGGTIIFSDLNLADRPTVKMSLADAPNFAYQNANHQDVTASLTNLQKQDIAATQINITVVPDAGNTNNGSAVWTYSIPDHAFDFLAEGETLTLTYNIRVDDNFAPNNEFIIIPITITITGTNDVPVITSSVPTITFAGGTSVPGGPLTSTVATSGTLTFKDVDLTDTHTVKVKLTGASLPGGSVPPGPLAAFANAMSVAIANNHDSTGTGDGTIDWSLADLPVYLADFIPKGETLTLTYTVTLTDSQGATATQTITVAIKGTDNPAVVWIATAAAGAPPGGFWKDAANWETGTVPTLNDDVIIITDQLHGLTPSYPVTIDEAAFANSVTMNDFGGPPPVLDNKSSLTIAGALTLSADSILSNFKTGSISVGGAVKIEGTASVTNAGLLTLSAGGDITTATSLVNTGTIDLAGGTLNLSADIANSGGTVQVDAGTTLDVSAATIDGGKLTISGTLVLEDASVLKNGELDNFGAVSVFGAVALDNETVINDSTILIDAGATLTLAQDTTIANAFGTITVDDNGRLVLDDAEITGGTITIAGTLESTGISAINQVDIINSGTINVTSGTLTIDPAVPHTITNHNLIEANGGILDISGDLIVNTKTLEAISGGTLKLTNVIVTNTGGAVLVDGTSKLYLAGVEIDHGTLDNAGHLYSVSDINTITAAVTNTGVIEVQGDTLNLAGGLTGAGSLIIDGSATLELAGADAQTITFAGGTDTLRLDNVAGQSFTGTIAGQASTGGTFKVTGAGNITSASGDALDFTASGGTAGAPAAIVLTPTGVLTGAENGLVVTQNGVGDISLTATGDVTGLAGNGISLTDSASGAGDITVNNQTGKATGTGAGTAGVRVQNLNGANDGDISITQKGGASGGDFGIDATTQGDGGITIDAGGHVTGSAVYGIRARSYGTGSETVTTEAGSVITSGSSGIVAVNRAISLDASDDSTITVNAYGTINSGASLNLSGNAPAGIQAGYTGTTTGTGANTDVNGTVIVNNHANITAAGRGIDAYNYGNGDVTVNSAAGTTISVSGIQSIGIEALALSGGTGNVTVALGAGVSITGATSYGIDAFSIDAGSISVTTADGDNISSGSTGILAVNQGSNIPAAAHSSIHVVAAGNIHSGVTPNLSGSTPGGIVAGYNPGGNGVFSNNVRGDVTVASDATIIADAGYGIEAFTWGVGAVTVTTGEDSAITAAGIAIGAFDHGGGNVSITNEGSATGAVALGAVATGAGNVTIINDGELTATGTAGIVVTQNDASATGSTHITNNGSVVGASGHYAIFVQENTTGAAVIDNSGTIGPDDAGTVTSTTYAIAESGGHLTINNSGHINGNISVATATFHNELGGIWTVSGTSVFGSLSTINNDGVIDLHDGASISGSGLNITNTGVIDSWGTASISGTITNNHTITIDSGTLTLFGSLSGSGSVTIDAGATLKLEGAVAQTITFSGTDAELKIDTTSFGGSIAGWAATDKIDLSTIDYGPGTYATYVSNSGHTGGVLTVKDAGGHSISMTLVGDYCNATFAGSDDGSGHTLITMNATDDVPHLAAGGASQSVDIAELTGATGSDSPDPSPPAAGAIYFTDVDLTDRPTASVTGQAVTWTGADHSTDLSGQLTLGQIHTIEHALSLQQGGNYNNGAVGWTYSVPDSALDFLGQGETLTLVSTITLSDGHGGTDTAQVTVNFSGANDAPTLDDATIASVSGDNTDPAGTSVADLFAGKFHDVDHGASLTAIAVTADNASADQGHWQYEVPGTDRWVDIGTVNDGHALVLSADTLLRFVPANGFSGTPGPLDVHALDDTYNGLVTTTAPVTIDITDTGIGHGGSTPVSDQAASIDVDVTPASPQSNVNVWTGDAGYQEWTIDGNWDLGHVPTVIETAVINTDDTVDLALDDNGITVGGLSLGNYAELDIVGTGYNADSEGVYSYFLVNGDLANSGLIDVQGAVLDVFHHVTNRGTIKADGQDALLDFGNLAGSTTDNAGGTLAAVDGGEIYLAYNTVNGGEIDATGYGSVVHLIDAILNGTDLVGDGCSTFEVGGGTTTFNGTAAPMAVDAQLHIDVGGRLVLDGTVNDSTSLDNAGTIVVESGASEILGDLTGAGKVQIMAASLELGGYYDGAVQFVGNGVGTLHLDSTSHFTGTVTGFSYGDTIDLAGVDRDSIGFVHSESGLQVHYGSGDGDFFTITGDYDESGFTEVSDGHGGTNLVWSHQSPVIDTTHFVHTHNADNTDTVTGLSVTGSPTETYTLSAVTAGAIDGTSVVPSSGDHLTLDQVKADIASVTYHPGDTPPDTDKITFTVTDSFGSSDTVNFIFNEGGTGPVTLTGTSGKDVIFASESNDTLAGNGGQDQFVFSAVPDTVQHTILDFDTTQDRLDLRLFDNINSFNDVAISQQLNDTLITLDDHETILLKNVVAANLRASDFIITNHGTT